MEEVELRKKEMMASGRRKSDTLDLAKAKPVMLGNLLDMPSIEAQPLKGRKLTYFSGKVPNINIFKKSPATGKATTNQRSTSEEQEPMDEEKPEGTDNNQTEKKDG